MNVYEKQIVTFMSISMQTHQKRNMQID